MTSWWSTGRSDLRPAGTQLQLPTFATAHEDKHIGRLLGEVMDEYGTHAIGLGREERPKPPTGA